jgi:hypothetical protein
MDVRFAALGHEGDPVYLYKSDLTTPYRQVLWGDYLAIDKEIAGGWLKVILQSLRILPNCTPGSRTRLRSDPLKSSSLMLARETARS